jgi:transcriptional regulator with XRE-family HTH domain
MAQRHAATLDSPRLATIVGANVYRLRVLRLPRLSQERLAEVAGVGLETIRLIEAARDPRRAVPSARLDTLDKIADALGVEPAELFRYDSDTRAYLNGESSTLRLIHGSHARPKVPAAQQLPLMRSASFPRQPRVH